MCTPVPIRVLKDTRIKLNKMKYDLGVSTIDDLINLLIKNYNKMKKEKNEIK